MSIPSRGSFNKNPYCNIWQSLLHSISVSLGCESTGTWGSGLYRTGQKVRSQVCAAEISKHSSTNELILCILCWNSSLTGQFLLHHIKTHNLSLIDGVYTLLVRFSQLYLLVLHAQHRIRFYKVLNSHARTWLLITIWPVIHSIVKRDRKWKFRKREAHNPPLNSHKGLTLQTFASQKCYGGDNSVGFKLMFCEVFYYHVPIKLWALQHIRKKRATACRREGLTTYFDNVWVIVFQILIDFQPNPPPISPPRPCVL